MKRVPVRSSALTSVGFDPMTNTLEVEYPRGKVVAHRGVPHEVYDRLLTAKSAGGFYNAYVREMYPFEYIEGD